MLIRSRIPRAPARQRGVVLFVSMVVLVALAIAALALLRSTDVATLLAGNLAFKRSSLNSTDLGYKAAAAALPADTSTSLATACYQATESVVDTLGVPTVLNDTASFDLNYPGCQTPGVAGGGEVVRYFTDRLCVTTGPAYDNDCTAAHVVPTSQQIGGNKSLKNISTVFRVTVRVDGPRYTTTFSQLISKQS